MPFSSNFIGLFVRISRAKKCIWMILIQNISKNETEKCTRHSKSLQALNTSEALLISGCSLSSPTKTNEKLRQ